MNNAWNKLKDAWNENPLAVIAAAGIAATAVAKLMQASTEARNARTWKKEVDRRRMK